jgi:hypothetical protein
MSALALGWSCYASSLSSADPDALVSLALKAIATLEQCSKASAEAAIRGTESEMHGNIGACLSGKLAAPCSWPCTGIRLCDLGIAPKAEVLRTPFSFNHISCSDFTIQKDGVSCTRLFAVAETHGHCLLLCMLYMAAAGGELPAASAAVIYFIRTAIISRLSEPGQRQLLSALATAASHAIAPPVIVAAMEGCGVLLELLGEPAAALWACAWPAIGVWSVHLHAP